MRIGVDIRSLLESRKGGVGYYTEKLLTTLLTANRTHTYVLFSHAWKSRPRHFDSWRDLGADIVDLRLPNKLLNLAFLSGIGPRIDELLGGVDLFWAPNLQFLSLSGRCRKIITCHDLSFERYAEFLSLKRRLWHRAIQPRQLYARFDRIVAVSQSTADDLMQLYGIPSEKIRVIYSGVEREHVDDADMYRVKNHYNLPRSFILTLGTLEPRKNLSSVLLAYEWLVEHRNLKEDLVIVGSKGWNYDDIDHTLRSLRHRRRVHFLGYIPHQDRASLYRLARLFVWPSFYEGFGFPPLEALSQGTPIIVGHHSAFPEVVGDAALMIDPYNIRAMSEAIHQLLASDLLRRELVERGRTIVERLSWQHTAHQMEQLFNEMVS